MRQNERLEKAARYRRKKMSRERKLMLLEVIVIGVAFMAVILYAGWARSKLNETSMILSEISEGLSEMEMK